MTQADSVHSTPPINTSPEELTARLAKEAKKRQRAIQRLRKLRTKAADEIDRLLEFLDAVDDTDLEPSLGFPEPKTTGDENPDFWWPYRSDELSQENSIGHRGVTDDREEADDLEPSLCGVTATAMLDCGVVDAELEEGNDEPSLGSLSSSGGDQTIWSKGNGADLEDQCEDEGTEDSGIGDWDGVLEQWAGTPYASYGQRVE